MKISKVILSMFLLSVLIISCNDDDDIIEPKGDYENGLLISGEGSGTVSGSVSFVSNDFVTVEHSIYNKVNAGKEFSTFLQSLAFDGENAYICVDSQNSITAVNRYTFEEVGVITEGLALPRYMTVVGDKGYATNWGTGAYGADVDDDFVAVIDLNSLTVTNTISVGIGPERIIENNGKLYVSHKGGFSSNNVITVIDIATQNTSEIVVKYKPDDLLFDNQNNLVVLCEGNGPWSAGGETEGAIVKINTSNNTVISEMIFNSGDHPLFLVKYENDLYYNVGSEIYNLSQTATELATSSLLTSEAALQYDGGLEIKDGQLFILNPNYLGLSQLDIYDLNTKAKTNSLEAPVAASKIYFN